MRTSVLLFASHPPAADLTSQPLCPLDRSAELTAVAAP
jgi:hypothetical protein